MHEVASGFTGQSDHFRLWQFSDTHLQADIAARLYGIDCDASLLRVFVTAMAQTRRAELCLLTGDLVHDETVSAYQRLRTYLETLAIPVYCLAGNHDAVGPMHKGLVSNQLSGQHVSNQIAGQVSCAGHRLHRQWLIVMLDTTVVDSEAGYLSTSECQRLASLLQQYPDQHVLLAMHHPPLPTAMAWLDNGVTLENPERVHAIVADNPRIRAVIWGHAHQASLAVRDGVMWAGCPSTMAQFKPGVKEFALDDKAAGFRWLDLCDDGRVEGGVIRVD